MGAEVHRPALQGHDQSGAVFDDLEGDLVQQGGLAPVILEAFQDDVFLSGTGDELEGAGAHGGGILLLVAGGQDGHGEVGQEFDVGLHQGDDHGAVVRGLHRGDGIKAVDDGGARVQTGGPGDGPDHVLGGDGVAVMEFHALPQGEGELVAFVVDGV